MKRLIKKSEDINTFDDTKLETTPENMVGSVELNQLSEADVRHDRCPQCKYHPLKRDNGFKICPRCETNYKIIDGKAYIVYTDPNADNTKIQPEKLEEDELSEESET